MLHTSRPSCASLESRFVIFTRKNAGSRRNASHCKSTAPGGHGYVCGHADLAELKAMIDKEFHIDLVQQNAASPEARGEQAKRLHKRAAVRAEQLILCLWFATPGGRIVLITAIKATTTDKEVGGGVPQQAGDENELPHFLFSSRTAHPAYFASTAAAAVSMSGLILCAQCPTASATVARLLISTRSTKPRSFVGWR